MTVLGIRGEASRYRFGACRYEPLVDAVNDAQFHRVRAPMPIERRQATFRSFAALGLLFTLLSAFAALMLAGLMALRKLAELLLPGLDVREIQISAVSDWVTWCLTQMKESTTLFLTLLGLALLGVAMILRQIVLAGLRD